MIKVKLVTAKQLDEEIQDMFSVENGYFGRVRTYGQTKNEFEFLGLYCGTPYLPWLESLSSKEKKELVRIIFHFKIHMQPLKKLLHIDERDHMDRFYSEMAWSHFATVILFGMLEIAIKLRNKNISIDDTLEFKGKNIIDFLNKNLSQKYKDEIVSRYKYRSKSEVKNKDNFNAVVNDMWKNVRCGFVHDATLESVGFEDSFFVHSGEKDGIPVIAISQDVSMPSWLEITWQAIFNAYGFDSELITVTSDNVRTRENNKKVAKYSVK